MQAVCSVVPKYAIFGHETIYIAVPSTESSCQLIAKEYALSTGNLPRMMWLGNLKHKVVTTQLICIFVFVYTKSRFSHGEAYITSSPEFSLCIGVDRDSHSERSEI